MNIARMLTAAACTGVFLVSSAGAASAAAPGTTEGPDADMPITTSEPQYAYEHGEEQTQQAHVFYGHMDGVGVRRGQARVHGWWTTDDANLKTRKATLTLELQHLSPDGWRTVNTGTRAVKPNQTGRRATASVPCSTTDVLGRWRSVLDIDVHWIIDDSQKVVSNVQPRACQP